MDVIEESVELAMLQFIDQPISNALITAILASVQFVPPHPDPARRIGGGSASYDPAENPSGADCSRAAGVRHRRDAATARRTSDLPDLHRRVAAAATGSDECADHVSPGDRVVTSKTYRGNRMNIQINSLTNANVYIDGVGLLGRAEEIEIPQPRHKMIDYKGLGMVGTAELWSGVDKLEAQDQVGLVRCGDAYDVGESVPDPLVPGARQPRAVHQPGPLRASLPVVYLMTGVFKDAGMAAFKHQAMVETNSIVSVYHCELYVAGTQIYLYDVFANVYVVGGVDQLSTFRTNLGG